MCSNIPIVLDNEPYVMHEFDFNMFILYQLKLQKSVIKVV
jgi:hypothetical protein